MALETLTRSRTAETRLVERAQIVLGLADGERPRQVAERLGLTRATAYAWLTRFNVAGIAGLQDRPRAGRPPTYTPAEVAEIIAAALTKPDALGLPFGSWTLDRLETYLNEQQGIPIKRSRIDEILIAEGLRWRTHEMWFGERVDPACAEKRGGSKRFTPRHRTEAS
jgi:transposase